MSMTISGIARNQMSDTMIKLATMKRINSAADDAAGLAISNKLESQITGLEQGTENTLDMKNLVKTAEGGLSGIEDSLQRMRELTVQASNGIYTDEDKAIIQNEISQLAQGINDIARGTQFNNINLLDGSFTNKLTASSANGEGATVSIPDVSISGLGLENFDLDAIDSALSMVSSTRSTLGALTNRFDHTVNSNEITSLNQAAAKSRIMDLDVAKATMDFSKEKILSQYQLFVQKNQQDNAKLSSQMLL